MPIVFPKAEPAPDTVDRPRLGTVHPSLRGAPQRSGPLGQVADSLSERAEPSLFESGDPGDPGHPIDAQATVMDMGPEPKEASTLPPSAAAVLPVHQTE